MAPEHPANHAVNWIPADGKRNEANLGRHGGQHFKQIYVPEVSVWAK